MKPSIFSLAILFVGLANCIFGQPNLLQPIEASSSVGVFQKVHRAFTFPAIGLRSDELSGIFKHYQVYEVEVDIVSAFARKAAGEFEVSFQFGEEKPFKMSLSPTPLWDGSAKMWIATEKGWSNNLCHPPALTKESSFPAMVRKSLVLLLPIIFQA
ncbi:MAG: hypothetical protein IPM82_20625 [Saprospiraceae bacterium]|nr:hypothetical protein [Saprospiraceae bacterium]